MDLREIRPADADAIRRVVEIENARIAVDCPWEFHLTPFRKQREIEFGWDGEPARHFLAYDGDTAVGYCSIHTSDYDNLDLAWFGVSVDPAHRRRGHGRAILELMHDDVRSLGRHLVGGDGWESSPGPAFLEAAGYERRSQAINRRMHLADVSLDELRATRDEAAGAAEPYELVRIAGRTPDELLDAVVEMTKAINDAPMDDLEIEDEVYSPERIRAYEDASLQGGYRFYRLVARHRASGELGGHTVVAVDGEQPVNSHQHDTSVVREHRGHRLGLLLKAEMVLWLAEAEPQVEVVDTWNAESNAHMIDVNERLGYRVLAREFQYQRRLG